MFKRSTYTQRLSTAGMVTALLSLSIGIASAQPAPNAIALVGSAGFGGIPFAASNGDGAFAVTNDYVPNFPAWAALPGVQVLTGDFNGDGVTDIALTGVSGWGSIPVAFSNGDGSFKVTNDGISNFAAWAAVPGVKAITGDFNCDGKTDIALVGGPGWHSIPVAFSKGDGTFTVTNDFVPNFPVWAGIAGVKALVGPFVTSGCGSIALFGGPGWGSIPVASSNGNGTFTVTNAGVPNFATWAGLPGVQMLTGYFTGNILDAPPNGPKFGVALTGVPGWGSIPVASSNGDGTFTITNFGVPNFPAWAATAGVKALALNQIFSLTSIALVGGQGWGSIPVASANGNGSFTVTDNGVLNFPTWASTPGVQILTGDFNGDFNTDIALVGVPTWQSIPVAYSHTGGTFTVTNDFVPAFPALAETPGVTALGVSKALPPPPPIQ